MMDTFDDKLDDAARALGEALPVLDDSIDDAIMARIKQSPSRLVAKSPGPGPKGLRWLLQPRPVQVRPIWIPIGLAAAAAMVLWLAPGKSNTGLGDLATRRLGDSVRDTVYVHFALSAPTATNVSLAGSFNNWEAAGLSLHKAADGSWEATLALPVGEHRYQFVVDGQRWIPDPSAQANIDDGFGGTNSVIVVGPKGVVRS